MQEPGVKSIEMSEFSKRKDKLFKLLNEVDLSKLTPTEIRFINARIDTFLNVLIFENR